MYPRIEIGGHEFSSYWLIFLIGVFLMFLFNLIRGSKRGKNPMETSLFTGSVIIISLIGAKLLYYFENPTIFLQNGIRLDGVSFFGSVFLVPIGIGGLCKITGNSLKERLDFLSPSLMLMLAILRIGCFVSGCCGGISVTLGGFYFSKFPTQLTEAFFDFMIMVGLLVYERFWDKEGRLYPFVMVYYGCLRFILEFVRDTPKDWLSMSHGQWFSLISILVGGYFLHTLEKKEKKNRIKKRRRR